MGLVGLKRSAHIERYATLMDGPVIEIEGGLLRPLRVDDVHPGYVSGLNDPEVNRFLVSVKQASQTRESVENFVKMNQETGDSILFGIWLTGSQLHCGTVRLHGIEHIHHTAHIGVCLFDKSVWGHGLAVRAVQAVTRWGIDNQKLRWIEAGMYAMNIASEKIFIAAGYDWICNIDGKYLLDSKPALVKVYAARRIERGSRT